MKSILTIAMLFAVHSVLAQKHPIEKTWYNAEKTSKIRIFKATDGKYYGKIVWLQTPNDELGQPRTDKNNEDPQKKLRPIMDLMIISAFTPGSEEGVFEGGKVYDPKNGKTYCGKLTLKGNTIDLRGFICGMSLLGRTSQWTLAE
jgi:uncharacterized protein (DUF2147 family)